MRKITSQAYLLSVLLCFPFTSSCQSNTEKGQPMAENIRKPAVAGKFYPSDKDVLEDSLKAMFKRAEPKKTDKPVLAIIAPHAGYVFSGEVAASAFNQVEKKHYNNVFVIGSSHHAYFEAASLYTAGDFMTPLGKVKVDKELSKTLLKSNSCFIDNSEAHTPEHSIEVQLPFLQYVLGNDINLVPVLIGTQSQKSCNEIAMALKPYFNDENLFVISTDFSHYPEYSDATKSDNDIAQAIVSNSPAGFLKTKQKLEESGMKNLATAICGWTSVLTLLDITENIPGTSILPVNYKNSGDSYYGDKDQVVGYYAMAVTGTVNTSSRSFLSDKEKKSLLVLARNTIEGYIVNHKIPDVDKKVITQGTSQPCGAFVSLHEKGELRGCIGNFSAEKPLYSTIQDMAVASSTQDYRFSPVQADEIDKLEIEISVLTPLRKISSIDEILLGKHGIYIIKGIHKGTFLPQVATETGWTKEEFLGHCARDKAGLDWDGWRNADIYVYEAIVFSEKDFK
jgi:AmmeMemoRadiSam system protein B/AmmeMemoRadiSam system protein A